MAFRTAHTSEQALATAVAARMADQGIRFPAVFPYNRYESAHSVWWLSFHGLPAHAFVKLFVGRTELDGPLRVGLVVERGYAAGDIVKASQRFSDEWDWHVITHRMREPAFLRLLSANKEHKVRVRAHASQGTGPKGPSHYLSFQPEPWRRTQEGPDGSMTRLLGSVSGASSLPALLDGIEAIPKEQLRFTWVDLYTCVALQPARPGDDRVRLDEKLVDEFLLPLAWWAWPALAPASPSEAAESE